MLTRRIIPCLDIIRNRVTKGIRFQNNIDFGDPVALAARYYEDGCDELVVYDITASAEGRSPDLAMIRAVARAIHVPFAVGGGIASLADMETVLLAGAEKISLNSLAVAQPSIIAAGARAFGSQCIVLGMDPVRTDDLSRCPSGYEVTTHGFRRRTGLDAREWARRACDAGAGEIVVNSVDADGTRAGFQLGITRLIADAVGVPVVASGGAGSPAHLREAFEDGHADAVIVAGILHDGTWTIRELKRELAAQHVPVRLTP